MPETKINSIISPTLIGAGVAVIASLAGAVGIDITSAEQTQGVTYATSAITGVAGLFVLCRNLYTKRQSLK